MNWAVQLILIVYRCLQDSVYVHQFLTGNDDFWSCHTDLGPKMSPKLVISSFLGHVGEMEADSQKCLDLHIVCPIVCTTVSAFNFQLQICSG